MAGGIDREKLIKFLRLTESDADGEALSAARMANRLLKAAGKGWEDVITGATPNSTQYGSPDYRTPPSKRGPRQYGRPAPPKPRGEPEKVYDDNIDHVLTTLTDQRHDLSTVMFLAALREYYDKNGYLTKPQYDAIMNMSDRKRGGTTNWRF